jgi:hypothetical protein
MQRIGILALAGVALVACSQVKAFEVGRAPDWTFTGRFIDVWGSRQAAEITSARRRDGDDIITEVVLARAPGQLKVGDVEVAVAAFRLRIGCAPVFYRIERITSLAQDGRVLFSQVIDDPLDMPNGPYTALANELCADASQVQPDFTSLSAFREEALSRPQMIIMLHSPQVVPRYRAR